MGNLPASLGALAAQARLGNVEAVRRLHFSNSTPRELDHDWVQFCTVASPEFSRIVDAAIPKRRPVPLGGIDFHRLHCLALDRLPDLLRFLLPDGEEGPTGAGAWAWCGRHPQRPELAQVCLLVGSWNEPNTGRSGRDLVSLYGHMFGVANGRAAHMLAEWLGAEVRSYA